MDNFPLFQNITEGLPQRTAVNCEYDTGGSGILESIALFNNINSAFDKYTTSWNSLDKTTASKVFNDEVLLEIEKIYDYVSKYPVDWKIDTMETILKRLEMDIRINFPYLNDKAIGILKNYFAYQWK